MTWHQHPDCPAPGARLCALAEVPDQGGREVSFGTGDQPLRILVLRQGERHWAYLNLCPHFSLPLNYEPQTFVTLDEHVVCAHHTAFFEFATGHCVDGPCGDVGLTPIPTERIGDSIHLARADE